MGLHGKIKLAVQLSSKRPCLSYTWGPSHYKRVSFKCSENGHIQWLTRYAVVTSSVLFSWLTLVIYCLSAAWTNKCSVGQVTELCWNPAHAGLCWLLGTFVPNSLLHLYDRFPVIQAKLMANWECCWNTATPSIHFHSIKPVCHLHISYTSSRWC